MGLSFLLYNPAATLLQKEQVVETKKTKPNQNHVMVQATAKCAGKETPAATTPAKSTS
jgi:hypothetical protein